MERNRLDDARARSDGRDRARERRERTRHLIELGGLVHKAGLVELMADDRATLLGAFLDVADRLREQGDSWGETDLLDHWRHRGLRAFDADKESMA